MPKDIRLIRKKDTGNSFVLLSRSLIRPIFERFLAQVMPLVCIVLFRCVTRFCLCRVFCTIGGHEMDGNETGILILQKRNENSLKNGSSNINSSILFI